MNGIRPGTDEKSPSGSGIRTVCRFCIAGRLFYGFFQYVRRFSDVLFLFRCRCRRPGPWSGPEDAEPPAGAADSPALPNVYPIGKRNRKSFRFPEKNDWRCFR